MAYKSVRRVRVLPLLLMVSLLSSGVFLALASAAGSVGRIIPLSQPQDFLRGYQAFRPGQPVTVFTPYGCMHDQNDDRCKYRMVISQRDALCIRPSNRLEPQSGCPEVVYALYPQNGLFDLIKVVAENDHIRIVDFYSKSLTADNLFHQWGDPKVINQLERGIAFRLVWQHEDYTATATVSHHQRIARLITLAVSANSHRVGTPFHPDR
jgi:hypothetical protein